MQLRRGQTPDSRSPLQHYCIFKLLSPCGNSQFDDADLQCWQATVTIWFSQTKRDAVYNAFSWENPFIFTVTCAVAKRMLGRESSWITKRQGCVSCVVGLQYCLLLLKSKDFFSYQIIATISSDLMQVNSSGSGSGCSPENIHFSGILGSLLELRTPAKQMYSRCPAVYMAYCTCLGNRPCTAIAWIRLWFSGI